MPDLQERLTAALADRYAIESEIGRGGMATVFLAEDLKHHRQVAIKVLDPELTASLGLARFLHEIEIAARLDHPHIVALFDSGEAAGLLYYVMPYVEGESLRDRLNREGQLPVDEALRIAGEVTDGLAYAHANGVVHRDVKPGNILLSDGHARIADFGVARAIDAAAADRTTATGLAAGTPAYMAPEQASGQGRGDERSDVYSVGCLLYEMLVGEPPYSGLTPQVLQARKLTESVPGIRSIRDTVSPGLEAVVARALARTPADRYQTARDLKAGLRDTDTVVGPTDTQEEKKRRGRFIAIAAVAFLALISLGYVGASTLGFGSRQTGGVPEIRSLAVLPLANISGDPGQEYLADAMTEAIRDELGRLSDLERVISRTSAMRYRETVMSLPEIASELGVDGVLEGTVQTTADEVQVTLRLMHGPTDLQIWTERYTEAVQDLFGLQRRISRTVAEQIHLALTPAERERLEQPANAPDPRAYDAYLRGRHYFDRWGESDALRAIAHYEEAIAIDPNFALAHAALAEACVALPALNVDSPPLSPGDCEEIAATALQLDEGLSEAHMVIAMIRVGEWNWSRADSSFMQALSLNPNSVSAHYWYAWYLSFTLRLNEALREARRAEELDPHSLFPKAIVAQVLLNDHRYDEVLAAVDEMLRVDPDYGAAFVYRAAAYAKKGMPEEALEAAERVGSRLGQDHYMVLGLRGWSYALAGHDERALEMIARIEELYGETGAPGMVGTVFLALGKEEAALDRLEKGYVAHEQWLPNMTSQPNFDGLRDHPQFQDLRRRMGLP